MNATIKYSNVIIKYSNVIIKYSNVIIKYRNVIIKYKECCYENIGMLLVIVNQISSELFNFFAQACNLLHKNHFQGI